MKEKKICIYKIISPIGKIYIGQTKDFYSRIRQHKAAQNKRIFNLYLSFKEHGFDLHKFEIVEECVVEQLNERERHWQDYYNSSIEGLNMSLTSTDTKKHVMSDITIEKKRNNNLGKKLTDKAKELITGELHGRAKLVLNTHTGIYYGCLKDACESQNLNYKNVRNYFSASKNRKNKTNFIYV